MPPSKKIRLRFSSSLISICLYVSLPCPRLLLYGQSFFSHDSHTSVRQKPFTALIPIFGAFLGCAVGAFLIFMVDPMKALMFIVLFLVLQQIEGNLIYPHVVGNSVGLPSIWVLAAVSIGGSLMGVVGMLIFIPIVSVAYALFREIVYLKLKKQGVDPAELEE